MVSSILRTKSVTTKVTESEYERLEELASVSGVNLSEWIRGKLLGFDCARRIGISASFAPKTWKLYIALQVA